MRRIVRARVDTVMTERPPPPKGVGPSCVTALSAVAGGNRLLRGDASAGLTPSESIAAVVRLEDEDGLCGTGLAGIGNPSVIAVMEQLFDVVLGRTTDDIAVLWDLMYRLTLNYGRRGTAVHAISGIDVALWDLLGKQQDRPIYALLGGAVRTRQPAYASWLYATEDLDALAVEAAGWAAQGFSAVKQRFGYGPADGARGVRRNVELVRTVVDAVGPEVDVMADAYMGWDVAYAIRCIRAIEDAGLALRWVEEPVIADDVRGMATVRRAVRTPIASGEHEATRYGFRELLEHHAVDVIQPDVCRAGGITESRRIWGLGEAFGVDVVAHVGAAHNLHLSIASAATPLVEYLPRPDDGVVPDEDQIFWRLFPDEPRPAAGVIVPTSRPGLGVTLDEAYLAHRTVRKMERRT